MPWPDSDDSDDMVLQAGHKPSRLLAGDGFSSRRRRTRHTHRALGSLHAELHDCLEETVANHLISILASTVPHFAAARGWAKCSKAGTDTALGNHLNAGCRVLGAGEVASRWITLLIRGTCEQTPLLIGSLPAGRIYLGERDPGSTWSWLPPPLPLDFLDALLILHGSGKATASHTICSTEQRLEVTTGSFITGFVWVCVFGSVGYFCVKSDECPRVCVRVCV